MNAMRAATKFLPFKWSLMLGLTFWMLVYKFSEAKVQLPDFVYANF